jgi:hypothetical protein
MHVEAYVEVLKSPGGTGMVETETKRYFNTNQKQFVGHERWVW